MKYITSKTHRYISIRTQASRYMMKKFSMNDIVGIKAHQKAYETYFLMYCDMIKEFTHKSYDDFYSYEYMSGAMESSREEFHEMTGVFIACASPYYIYCIPRTEIGDKIYDWILSNCKNKFKVLKKTYGTYFDRGVQTWAREMYKISDSRREMLGWVNPYEIKDENEKNNN